MVGNAVYFPDWAGNFYKLDARAGQLIWSHTIASYTGDTGKEVSRTSPAVYGRTVYIGTRATQNGSQLLAIDTQAGALRWRTQLDSHPLPVDTQSPVVFDGVVYVGVASLEEGAAANPSYPCCSFRGSMLALNAATGAVLWKTYTAPVGYTGSSIWGSTAVVDRGRNSVYVTTGNNYTDPAGCPPALQPGCLAPTDYVDSVLALDMSTGAVRWHQRLSSGDDWNVACFYSAPGSRNCPSGNGPDYDFGSGVNLFTINNRNHRETVLGAGQKSGIYSVFDATTGALVWATQVGPGSSLGGIEWGSATDGENIYVAVGNLNHLPYTQSASGTPDSAGSWNALDGATGKLLWHVPDPNGAIDLGPMTVVNNVVYAPSTAGSPTSQNMFALDAASGNTLWSYAAGGSVIAGAVVVGNTVYWGSGYSNLPIPGLIGNNKFYAFSKNDN